MQLKIASASLDAARYACRNWHYSGTLPSGKKILFGVWEDDRFVGVVIYSRGPGPQIGCPFGVTQAEVCELTRIAMRDHQTPVTRVVAITLKILKRENPGLRVVVSFADPEQGHHGGIYQGGNWIFIGVSNPLTHYIVGGVEIHNRTVMEAIRPARRAGGKSQSMIETIREHFRGMDVKERKNTPRYKYAYPFDEEMRRKVEAMRKDPPGKLTEPVVGVQNPNRGESIDGDAPGSQPGEGVSIRPRRSTKQRRKR